MDIGTGNGEYLCRSLIAAKITTLVDLFLLEPSRDLIPSLKKTIKSLPENFRCQIIQDTWEGYSTADKYDLILASHLYHIKREDYYGQFKKMVDYLNPGGILFFVMREPDEIHDFKMKFKPKLFGESYKSQSLDEAVEVFRNISLKNYPLTIERYKSNSSLVMPYRDSPEDTAAIVEFYLNKSWREIPDPVRSEIMEYIASKNGKFKIKDGIAVIKRI